MKKTIQNSLKERILIIDGAMGTMIHVINWRKQITVASGLRIGIQM
jgi:methionine synthase I (cobalamin-dependent)